GVNAMSDRQQAAMLTADDSYAGSSTFTRLSATINDIFGTEYFLPAHQGRACENILAHAWVREGSVIPMNYHFTTTKSHITMRGGRVEEVIAEAGLQVESEHRFKGDVDLDKLAALIDEVGAENIPFVRMEAGTNLIGGQPVSLANYRAVGELCRKHGLRYVLDASLLQDNLHFIATCEDGWTDASIAEITRAICDEFDLIYFSGRKLGFGRGGGIITRSKELYEELRGLVPLFEGFLTYGGMSVREMEALAIGLEETMDPEVINQGPEFIAYMAKELLARGVPIVTPPGGLGVHIDAGRFIPQVPQEQYPSGALAAAVYLTSGVRGMERGTLSEQRDPDGSERLADMELLRLAVPRRVFTLSQLSYAVDRIAWLYENRDLIGGLAFTDEPEILRFFYGRLAPIGDWQHDLVAAFRRDLGDSL
ncbi:MAG: tryptophanase, partial [Propionibacterium sp.]|nr:tryptophanase [Propionibacterium sp.]